MEEVFNNLKKEAKNDVDVLIMWLQDARLVDKTKEAEEKLHLMFKDVSNKVEIDKFKDIIKGLAEDGIKTFEEMCDDLAAAGPVLLDAIRAGYRAFKDSLTVCSSGSCKSGDSKK